MRILVATPAVLLLLVLSGCGGSDAPTATEPHASSKSAAAEAPTSSSPPTGTGSGAPKTEPCDLLTKGMAEGALGVPVGPSARTPGEGNVTCTYGPADGSPNMFVLLTTYAGSGKDALATATAAFPDARSVPDLGDAALVSRKGHAIGVSVDDLLFGMSLLRADSFSVSPEVSEAQLITLARTVIQAR